MGPKSLNPTRTVASIAHSNLINFTTFNYLYRDVREGMYLIGAEVTTQKEYPNCGFWKEWGIVPQYGKLH